MFSWVWFGFVLVWVLVSFVSWFGLFGFMVGLQVGFFCLVVLLCFLMN